MPVLRTRQGVRKVSKGKANCPQTGAINCYSLPPPIPYMWRESGAQTAAPKCPAPNRKWHMESRMVTWMKVRMVAWRRFGLFECFFLVQQCHHHHHHHHPHHHPSVISRMTTTNEPRSIYLDLASTSVNLPLPAYSYIHCPDIDLHSALLSTSIIVSLWLCLSVCLSVCVCVSEKQIKASLLLFRPLENWKIFGVMITAFSTHYSHHQLSHHRITTSGIAHTNYNCQHTPHI